MALFRLVIRLSLRNRGRAFITALGVGVTLLAFLILRTLVSSWYSVNDASSRSDQLEVRHKVSIAFGLYRRMGDKIRTLPGVEEVACLIWFSGNYKDEKRRFGQLAVEGESYFKIHPEYAAPPEQMEQYMADTSGALVGVELARKYGWKLGDKVTLTGTIFPGDWDFNIRGIYTGENAHERTWMFMHYKHVHPELEETHRLVVKADPSASKKIDALFANSDTPTKTESQLSVQRSWASWSATVVSAIDLFAILVLLVLILVLGNAMGMAMRDGIREHAAMRAIGYKSWHIVALVVSEGLLIALVGVTLGLLVAPSTLKGLSKVMDEQLGGSWDLKLNGLVTLSAVSVALGASMLACALPAWRSGRMPIADALRKFT